VTGDVAIDSTTLKVDSANNRVGICTSTPGYNLDVNGTCNISGNVTIGGTLTATGGISGIGTILSAKNASSVTASTTAMLITSLTIPAGKWSITCCCGGTGYPFYSLNTSNAYYGTFDPTGAICGNLSVSGPGFGSITLNVTLASSTTYYMYLAANPSGFGNPVANANSGITAMRIA
jgi:hypothetical protein